MSLAPVCLGQHCSTNAHYSIYIIVTTCAWNQLVCTRGISINVTYMYIVNILFAHNPLFTIRLPYNHPYPFHSRQTQMYFVHLVVLTCTTLTHTYYNMYHAIPNYLPRASIPSIIQQEPASVFKLLAHTTTQCRGPFIHTHCLHSYTKISKVKEDLRLLHGLVHVYVHTLHTMHMYM